MAFSPSAQFDSTNSTSGGRIPKAATPPQASAVVPAAPSKRKRRRVILIFSLSILYFSLVRLFQFLDYPQARK
jgi:hypothetical protein